MSDIVSAMKPQDQIIYLLGQIQGELGALHKSTETNSFRQDAINAAATGERAAMRLRIDEHSEILAAIRATSVPRLTWPQLVTGVAAAAALIISVGTLFPGI